MKKILLITIIIFLFGSCSENKTDFSKEVSYLKKFNNLTKIKIGYTDQSFELYFNGSEVNQDNITLLNFKSSEENYNSLISEKNHLGVFSLSYYLKNKDRFLTKNIKILGIIYFDKKNYSITKSPNFTTKSKTLIAYEKKDDLYLSVKFFNLLLNNSNFSKEVTATGTREETLKFAQNNNSNYAITTYQDKPQNFLTSQATPFLNPIVITGNDFFAAACKEKIAKILIPLIKYNTDYHLFTKRQFLKLYINNDVNNYIFIKENIIPATFQDNINFLNTNDSYLKLLSNIDCYFSSSNVDSDNVLSELLYSKKIISTFNYKMLKEFYKYNYQREKSSYNSEYRYYPPTAYENFFKIGFFIWDDNEYSLKTDANFLLRKMKAILKIAPNAIFKLTYYPAQDSYYSQYLYQQTMTSIYKLFYKEISSSKIKFNYIPKQKYIEMKSQELLPENSGISVEVSFPKGNQK